MEEPGDYRDFDSILFNPKRFMVALLLYLHGPTVMADLQRATGLTWGDLDSNIRRLREAGYVGVRKVLGRDRPRTLVYLTPLGRERLEELMERLERVLDRAKGQTRQPSSYG